MQAMRSVSQEKFSAMHSKSYFAEHATDQKIRERYFPDFARMGVMVEVGGGTPEFLSMSKHFKHNGWRVLIVEPNPLFASMHRAIRNEVVECACSSENQRNVPFTVVSQQVEAYGGTVTDHSFSSLALKPSYEAMIPKENVSRRSITVDARRIDSILVSQGISDVDFLSVDVEGWEIEVMKGLDTTRHSVGVIVLENLMHEASYIEYMRSIHYKLDMKIEYNYVFTAG